jgi:hypothetical protein
MPPDAVVGILVWGQEGTQQQARAQRRVRERWRRADGDAH